MDVRKLAEEVQPQVVAFRRDLHRHPEPSMQEFRTTDRIAEELTKLGIAYKRLDPTGLTADITGTKPGKGRTIALRADIDALSITEVSGVEFSSENPGFMHACGHDTHAAMLLGAAMILNAHRDEFCGTVRLLFQPAEEIAKGAKAVLAQHALDGVDAMYGQHIMATAAPGLVALRDGGQAAAADIFRIKVIGKAGHGAMPEACVDATVAAAAIVMNLQSIVSRELPPSQPVVVTVGKLESGTRFNIISGEANMEGTIRSFDPEIHHSLPAIVERIAKGTAAAYRCEAEVEYEMMTEVLMNDPHMSDLIRAAAKKVIASPNLLAEVPRIMGGEDFADYTLQYKCGFAMIGGGGKYPQHSDHFRIEEDSFITGVSMHVQVALDYLAEQAQA